MLSEWERGILKANRIPEDDVAEVSGDMTVTFKDGSKRTICEVYSRVMGYIRPSTEYNVGKYSEFESRKCFCEDAAVAHLGDTPDDAA